MVSLPGFTVCWVMSELSELAEAEPEPLPEPHAADSANAATETIAAAARMRCLPENAMFFSFFLWIVVYCFSMDDACDAGIRHGDAPTL